MKSDAAGLRQIAGLIEQSPCPLRIVIVLPDIAIIGPTLRRKDAAGGLGLISPQIMDDGLPVDGVSNRLTHAAVLQNGIAQVESQIVIGAAGCNLDLEVGITTQWLDHVSA